jgi:anti-sigma B factor antagonist
MTSQVCEAAVIQLPETLSGKQARSVFSELERCMNIDRPCIVFDYSKVRQMDRSAVHLLLCCLEEALMRNGDVKLAAIPAGARALLESTGVGRLFKIFDTNAEAVNSFRRVGVDKASNLYVPGSSHLGSENAT